MDIPFIGLTISRTKATGPLSSVESRGGWWPLLRESYAGAWQSNVTVSLDTVLTNTAVFACVSLISSDIAKMGLRLMERQASGIWVETESNAFSPVLRKPNHYQTRIKFIEQWITSKLVHGNAYALKQRDGRGLVTALYLLDPTRVRPLVAPDGSVYYDLMRDDLSKQPQQQLIVPAREIIHDVMVALYHPLVGVSPITACGLAATQGLTIQQNSTNLFTNNSNPGGVLTAPGAISDATAARLKAYWDANYTGANVGKVAVLGDGLKFEPMMMKAVDAQLIEQLKWTAEAICSAYHIPPYMIGVGPAPTYNNVQVLSTQYYTQCIQSLVEALELVLDEGLGLGPGYGNAYGTEFNVDDLLRMDSSTMMDTISKGIGAGVLKPNEGRQKLNLKPVQGGDTPYLQQQNYSLAALDRRDTADPAPASPGTPPPVAEPDPDDETPDGETPKDDGGETERAVAKAKLVLKVQETLHAA
jgi:HK97 family phage portal protein